MVIFQKFLRRYAKKTKIIQTLHETSTRDSMCLDFIETITGKTEQREKMNNICGQSHERYQHGMGGRAIITKMLQSFTKYLRQTLVFV